MSEASRARSETRAALDGRGPLIVALALVGVFAVPRVLLALRTQDLGHDGALYTDVALHVSAGRGLVSSVSDFHHGFRAFPHPTSLYPAWPLVLGAALRVLPLKAATVWFPVVLSCAALVAAYALGRRITRGFLPGHRGIFDGGHVFLVVLGAHTGLFSFSASPYTEPLALLLLMVFLLRAQPLTSRRRARDGVELGLWLAVLVYTRAHFLVFAGATLLALMLEASLRARAAGPRSFIAPVLTAATLSAALAPYIAYMSTFLARPGLLTYLRYDQARAIGAEVLSPLVPVVSRSESLAARAQLLAGGLVRSFTPGWKHGYFDALDLLACAPPLALLWLAARAWAQRARARAHLRVALQHPQRAWALLLLGCAAAGFSSLHVIHKSWGTPWYFTGRHGLTAVLLFSIAWCVLLFLPRRPLAVAFTLCFAVGALRCVAAQVEEAAEGGLRLKSLPLRAERPELVRWIVERQKEHGTLVLAVSQGLSRKLAWALPEESRAHVGLHQMYPEMGLSDARALTGPLGARYLLITADRFAPQMLAEPGFFEDFELVDEVREARTRRGRGDVLVFRRRSAVPGPLYLVPSD